LLAALRQGLIGLLHVEATVAIEQLFPRNCGYALAGYDDTREVEGIGRGYRNNVLGLASASGAERFDGLREGVLFAAEAGEEAAAADLAARFKTAEDVEEIAPPGGVRFADEEIAEENAVAGEEHLCGGFEGAIGLPRLLDWSCGGVNLFAEEGPTAGGAAGGAPAGGLGGAGLAPRVHDGAKLVESVGCSESSGCELPEGVLGLLAGEVGDALDVVGEAGSTLLEERTEQQGFGAEGSGELCLFDALLGEGVG
jgi:hypothetical protein